jgi:ADP-ribosyl-[dinitrogen reductase] hydrolase
MPFPASGFHGEENAAHRVPAGPDEPLWLVDPHDGTSATHDRVRGAAVSIALMWRDRPVLGVVYSFACPDDRGDLFAWAEGCGPLRRNGRPVLPAAPRAALDSETIVAVSHRAAD